MAIFLGSNYVGENLFIKDRSIENSIVEGTISTYENDRLTYLRNCAFRECSSLTSVDLPMVSYAGNYAFRSCSSLTSVSLPMVSYIGSYAFGYCSSLTSIDLPMVSYIGSFAFSACRKLLSLYLGSTSVCSLYSSNAFTSTPIAGYTASTSGVYGSIYVPASLYNDYIIAKNWSAFSSRFVSI